MLRQLVAVFLLILPLSLFAQDSHFDDGARAETQPPVVDRSATGGAQTLEDILRRQNGLSVDDEFRREKTGGKSAPVPELGTLGGASDPDLWRGLRYGTTDVTVSHSQPGGAVLVQDGGMRWLEFRQGPLPKYGGGLLLGTIGLLAIFYLLRGRVLIENGKSGRTMTRFQFIERFAHWLMGGAFILLALTGLLTLFGRKYFIGWFGSEFNSQLLIFSKFIHNNVSWAFMLGLILVFFMWVWHNLPDRTDITWIAQAGGIIGSKHPPAKKFNVGQKVIFWSVILLGGSISVSGLSLLFPFQLPLFEASFHHLNEWGVPGWFGLSSFPGGLSPQEEMQFAQLWHAIVSFVLMAVILAHIYIGTLGMEGAYDAMGSGQVDETWAKQHHSIWYETVNQPSSPAETPETHPAE